MALIEALLARSPADFDMAADSARGALTSVFSDAKWGLVLEANPYTEANLRNLWDNNQVPVAVREALAAAGKNQADFDDWLGGIHYTWAAMWAKRLFSPYKENRGWRVVAMGLPAIGIVVVGLASNYQNGMNNHKMTTASHLLYDRAKDALHARGVDYPGRAVTADDWDRAGISGHIRSVAGVELPEGVPFDIKAVRSTTVKKILTTFFSFDTVSDEDRLRDKLTQLEICASIMAGY